MGNNLMRKHWWNVLDSVELIPLYYFGEKIKKKIGPILSDFEVAFDFHSSFSFYYHFFVQLIYWFLLQFAVFISLCIYFTLSLSLKTVRFKLFTFDEAKSVNIYVRRPLLFVLFFLISSDIWIFYAEKIFLG